MLVSLAFALAPGAAVAQGALPASVARDLNENADLCREVGGKPATDRAVERADLNGDGREDFVFYVGSIVCDGAASLYGDREKRVTVYAGDGSGGAATAFSDSVFDAKVEGAGASAKLWLTVSGAGCGKPPAADFASENFCERAIVWNAKTKKFDYAPVSTARMIQ
jgi:hypothetical protein